MYILVADQDVEQRRPLVKILEQWGHTIVEALSEREAIDLCRDKCPDLIFIDKELSGASGIEILRMIRLLGGHAVWVPIVMTGHQWNNPEMLQGLEAGADDFLTKPIPEIRVLTKVRSAERQLNLKNEVFTVAHNLVIANRALESIVTQDVLTGIGNSNTFDETLEKEWFQGKKDNQPLALILSNLDYFQAYNQTYGATKGDVVIRQVAEALKLALPDQGFYIARLIGETFGILLPRTAASDAHKIAEQLRGAIETLQIPHINSGCCDHITASFGISVAEPGHYTNPWDLKEAADYALYQAKHNGRNRSYVVPAAEAKPL